MFWIDMAFEMFKYMCVLLWTAMTQKIVENSKFQGSLLYAIVEWAQPTEISENVRNVM